MADAIISPSSRFAEEIQEKSGQPVNLCYQCKKCACGCPVSFIMKPYNSDILKLIQLGEKETVLKSGAIWACVACKTCGARCPNGIDISAIMDVLREMALSEGTACGDRKTPAFHESFLATVKQWGRSHEAGIIGLYKMRTGTFTQDLGLGLKLFAKRKIKLLPERIKGTKEIRRIFRKAKGEDK